MRTVISVQIGLNSTTHYEYSIKEPRKSPMRGFRGGDLSQTAAKVTAMAMAYDPSIIIAPDEIMNLIPKEMGGKA